MHPEPIKARIIRVPVIRLNSQLYDPVLSANLTILHLKVLITGRVIRIRVLIGTEFNWLLIVLILQSLKL